MLGQARVMHPRDLGLGAQPMRQCQGLSTLGLDPQAQCLQTLQDHPGVEGCQGHAGAAQDGHELVVDQGTAAAQCTGHHAALTVEVLGARVHDDVSAQVHWLLQRGRGKTVVHRQQGTGLVGHVSQRGDVTHLGQRIGRGLGKQQPGVGAYRLAPLVDIGLRNKARLHAKLAEFAPDELDGRAKHRA